MWGIRRDLDRSPSPIPLAEQGHPDQIPQEHIQVGFKHLQRKRLLSSQAAWGSMSSSVVSPWSLSQREPVPSLVQELWAALLRPKYRGLFARDCFQLLYCIEFFHAWHLTWPDLHNLESLQHKRFACSQNLSVAAAKGTPEAAVCRCWPDTKWTPCGLKRRAQLQNWQGLSSA